MKLTSFAQYQSRDNGRFVQNLITDAVREGTMDFGEAVLARAQELVPVDTGELRSSGSVTATEDGRTLYVSVDFSAPHAPFVEFGTGLRGAQSAGADPDLPYNLNWAGMAAQPYLRTAWEELDDQAQDFIRKRVAIAL